MLAMKYDHTTTARLDVLQAAIEAMFEALAPDAAAAVRAGLAQRLDDLDACQPEADAAHAGVAAALLAALVGYGAHSTGTGCTTAMRTPLWAVAGGPGSSSEPTSRCQNAQPAAGLD